MKRLKLVLTICAIYIVVVFSGTWLSMYLDSKFYGEVRAQDNATINYSEPEQNYDDSEWHYNAWMQWKAEIAEKAKHRVVYVFPDDNDKQTKLTVVHDPVLDMYCYTLKNRPYQFKTGLNCFPGWMIRQDRMTGIGTPRISPPIDYDTWLKYRKRFEETK